MSFCVRRAWRTPGESRLAGQAGKSGPADFARVAHLVRRYADLPLDAVDAAVVATAERLGATKIATVDRKDFRIVVPAHCSGFELLPTELE